jgi:ribonuclease H2 subunit A
MIYACCAWPVKEKARLASLGFADSKTLTEKRREQLFNDLKSESSVLYETEILTPEYISNMMLGRVKVSLNVISMESAETLIRRLLTKGTRITNVYVDTVGTAESYQSRLSSRFPGIEFKVTPKADSLFPVVSAASIVAKVTRDQIVESYKDFIGDVGSGYPADPNTQNWLKNSMHPVFGYPSRYVRISWKTCTTAMETLPKVTWPESQEANPFYYYETLGMKNSFL